MIEFFILFYETFLFCIYFFSLKYCFKKQRERDEWYLKKLIGTLSEALIEYEAKRFDNEMTFRYYDMQNQDKNSKIRL